MATKTMKAMKKKATSKEIREIEREMQERPKIRRSVNPKRDNVG